jgi:hypothetical protein
LHLNAGVTKPRDDKREWGSSVAIERELFKRTTLFAELAREGEATLLHAGARHWIKREKMRSTSRSGRHGPTARAKAVS